MQRLLSHYTVPYDQVRIMGSSFSSIQIQGLPFLFSDSRRVNVLIEDMRGKSKSVLWLALGLRNLAVSASISPKMINYSSKQISGGHRFD